MTLRNWIQFGWLPALALGAGVPVCGAWTVQTNVVYAQGAINAHTVPATKNLSLDVYRPSDPSNATGRTLVLVHGGGFTSGDRTSPDMVDAATYFADRGWVCLSIDYRLLSDDAPAPSWIEALNNPLVNAIHAAMVDTKRAIRWARTHAVEYRCDPGRVAGLGHSAGAYCIIQACITDDADFANDAGTSTPDQWAGCPGNLNAGVEVSGGLVFGDSEFDSGDSPLLIWHGDADGTVPYSEAVTIGAQCVEHRIPHRLFTLVGKDHGVATWTAISDGRSLKAHAFDFMNLFFDLHMAIRVAPDTVCLDWPSVSNAVYDVRATVDLALPFATGMVSAVTAETDRCTAVVPRDKLTQFYQIGIRSGQAGE